MIGPEFFQTAKRMLEFDEGRRAFMYLCPAGRRTIGIGHNLDAVPIGQRSIDTIFEEDFEATVAAAKRVLGATWDSLTDVRRLAVSNMVFQMGATGFAAFKETIRALAAGDYALASERILASKYARQTPARAVRVATMIRHDILPPEYSDV